MRSSLFLRIGSVITLLFAAGHTLGARESWSPAGDTPVLRAMKAFRFEAMGVSRTYWDFYFGFGLIISVLLFAQAVVLWQLAAIAETEPICLRTVIASLFLASVACAFVAWKFIFAAPIIFSVAIAACLGLAFLTAGGSAAS